MAYSAPIPSSPPVANANYANSAGSANTANYANNAGTASYANTAGYANSSGLPSTGAFESAVNNNSGAYTFVYNGIYPGYPVCGGGRALYSLYYTSYYYGSHFTNSCWTYTLISILRN